MKRSIFINLLLVLSLLVSCSTEPEPINYGVDACHFCEMTIVSQAHSARAVSAKGKQFKYDAIECMVNDVNRNDTKMAVQQVANYLNPGSMIEVSHAAFIINDSINSPMGANLAALKNAALNHEGLLTWQQLKTQFLNRDNRTLK